MQVVAPAVGAREWEHWMASTWDKVFNLLIIFVLAYVTPACFIGFWSSMLLGSALARAAVTKVSVAARKTNPNNAEAWTEAVERPALGLDRPLQVLSDAWGNGLLGTTLGLWLMALGKVMTAIDPVYTHAQVSQHVSFTCSVCSALKCQCHGRDAQDIASENAPGSSTRNNLIWCRQLNAFYLSPFQQEDD